MLIKYRNFLKSKVRMTNNKGFLTIYGHRDNLLNAVCVVFHIWMCGQEDLSDILERAAEFKRTFTTFR